MSEENQVDVKMPTNEEMEQYLQQQNQNPYQFRAYTYNNGTEHAIEIITPYSTMLVPYLTLKEMINQFEQRLLNPPTEDNSIKDE